MKKSFKSFIFLCWIYIAALIVTSCTDEAACDGFPNRFSITGFNLSTSISQNDNNLFDFNEIGLSDTVKYELLTLNLNANFDAFSHILEEKSNSFGSLYACSPPPLTPLDTITSIQVLSLKPEGFTTINTGINLTSQFDIISFSEESGFSQRVPLDEFNRSGKPASTSYFLFLNTPPKEITEIGYQIKTQFSNGNAFNVSSGILYISP